MNLLNEDQEQQLKEISKYLLQVRQEKGIRIEEVAAKTNIRLYFLQALDAGKFTELPEPVYVQGFIRRYADMLGLDGQALAKSFNLNAAPVITPEFHHEETEHIRKRPNIRIPLFVPFIVLIAGAAIALIYTLNPKLITQSFAKQDSAATKPVQTEPSPLTVAPPAATPDATVANLQNSTSSPITPPLNNSAIATPSPTPSTANNPNAPVAVTLELQGNSWVQVKADGKTEFVGELTKGQRRTWTAKKQLTVRSGNAGAVLISVNEKPAQILGANGRVKEVTYTPGVVSQ
ncbi:helix-turn-helix domain-containing protein [Nostoc sp. MS1]|uniref:helix-turn-helix domain-containing protein n=1 Tax=Nostoc sp. MS1 TaxID=2764711 RepID=UPI001CC628C8|nr:RodZ family helix-turn-helix domain-containing protein [Nostoc sp. MS1]BCL36257.1 helix-turn-helix domain-containing protein [Nostoc sp. MS1]